MADLSGYSFFITGKEVRYKRVKFRNYKECEVNKGGLCNDYLTVIAYVGS